MRIIVPVPRRVGSFPVPLTSRRNAVRQGTLFDFTDASPNRENKDQSPPKDTKNIVIFGETGVGKSSLINLIAGERISETSSAAAGCTLDRQRHLVTVDNQRYVIWDTAGLDEGTQGSVPAEKAEAYLKQLIQDLAKSSGVDLLVYCVRGTRVRSALLANYNLFYSAICRRKVPIAIVITGLENQEGSMETWWMKNEPQFTALKMSFDGHACVTTLEPFLENPGLKERRDESRTAVIRMIISTCRTQQWKPAERSWVESAFADIRAMLSPRDGYDAPLANVIMDDGTRSCPDSRDTRRRAISFHNPVALSFSLTQPLSIRSPVSISNEKSNYLPFDERIKRTPERLFRVYQVPRKPKPPEASDENPKTVTMVKRGADLLIFCVKSEESADVKSHWEHFSVTYGGDLSPQIVVVIGASDEQSAEEWWKRAVDGVVTKHDVHIAYWPSTTAKMEEATRRLQYLINERCIDCSKVTFIRNENLFRRPLRLDMTSLATLWTKPQSSTKEDFSSSEQDMLTKWGVWDEMPERSPISPTKDGHW